jgi:hypothetical protein
MELASNLSSPEEHRQGGYHGPKNLSKHVMFWTCADGGILSDKRLCFVQILKTPRRNEHKFFLDMLTPLPPPLLHNKSKQQTTIRPWPQTEGWRMRARHRHARLRLECERLQGDTQTQTHTNISDTTTAIGFNSLTSRKLRLTQ